MVYSKKYGTENVIMNVSQLINISYEGKTLDFDKVKSYSMR